QKELRIHKMELGDDEVGGKSSKLEKEGNEEVDQKMDTAFDRRNQKKDQRGGVVAGRVEFSVITDGGSFSTLPINQLNGNNDIEESRVDGEVHSFKENFGRLGTVEGALEELYYEILCQTHIEVDIVNGCIRNRMSGDARIIEGAGGSTVCLGEMVSEMASEKLKLEEIECYIDGKEKIQMDIKRSQGLFDLDRQYSNGV
ncbi:MAG: hypothetical protein EZS28_005637, partial [Streblomastix strix]